MEELQAQSTVANSTRFGFSKDPERKLLAAVLIRAVLDYTQFLAETKKAHTQRSAGAWIYSDEEYEPGQTRYTFLYVCEHLDLCPATTRRAIEDMKEYREANGRVRKAARIKRG